MSTIQSDVAVDPVTIVIKECITLSTAMRKYSKYTSQTGVAALLSGGSEIFSNQDDSLADTFNNLSTSKNKDPLLSGLVQLRLMLNNLSSLDSIDSLTLLQPFLVVISTPTISGYITSLALDSLQKFITFNIISEKSINHTVAYREAVNALTHCRFEGSEQTSDDSVLLKVLVSLEAMIKSKHSDIFSDSIVYEVLQTVMSLACNKKRTEVLRKAAEMSMMSITVKIFTRLRYVEATDSQKYINDEDFSKKVLKDDTIGTGIEDAVDEAETKDELSSTESIEEQPIAEMRPQSLEENYGLPVIKDYLSILISLIMPENQYKHNNSTKVFGLTLLNIAVEVSGNLFPNHPMLFTLISDPIFKNVLFIIQNTDKLSLLQSALHLFTTLVIVMGENLQKQIELTFESIFDSLQGDKSTSSRPRTSAAKELIIEQISILWTRSPSFFTNLFVNYDCNLNRSDLATKVLSSLTKLALPESALTTADSVPPICLEGLISFIDNMYDILKGANRQVLDQSSMIEALKERAKKTEFIRCTDAFNEKPKKGIALLIENNFINSSSENDIAKFLFEENGRLNKKAIGEHLASPESLPLLKKFIELFDFKDLRIDEAIRIMLTKFRLPGESQQIERIVETFSASYVEAQEYDPQKADQNIENDYGTVQPDADSVFILSFSVIMLNTDLHNPQVKKHMTFDDYTYNLKGCNDQKDFPMWYLDRIFCSIRDKEIVMPEEHHGTERWFDDAWNNLVSSTTVITQTTVNSITKEPVLDQKAALQFDKAIFEIVGDSIVKTLFKIFEVASDDHISTRMLTSIDKCSRIASFFEQRELFNTILETIAKSTLLTKQSSKQSSGLQDMNEIPVVQINLEESKEVLTVSSLSVRFGRDFKSQLCNVVLFRILQQNDYSDMVGDNVWTLVVEILLNLFENFLISPDVFPDLQKTLKIGRLPRPAPEYSINKSKINKGLLSTFASYLKGDEEPTDEELKYSLSALECIKSSRVTSSIFGNENNVMGPLVSVLLKSVPMQPSSENSRYFESEILFIMELALASYLFCKDNKDVGRAVLSKLKDISALKDGTKAFKQRISAYKLLLVSVLDEPQAITDLINNDVLAEKEIYNSEFFVSEQGFEMLRMILSLTEIENYNAVLLQDDGFWKILRLFAATEGHTFTVFEFLDNSILKKEHTVMPTNFLSVLGLLDEISSVGAMSGEWEEHNEKLAASGQKPRNENPYQDAVELSLKSINATSRLLDLKHSELFSQRELTGLLQALAHQCYNPCFQLRSYALSMLDGALSKHLDMFSKAMAVSEIFENGLLAIMEGDKKRAYVPDIMALFSKVYIHYLNNGTGDNETFLKLMNIFDKYVDDPAVEKTLRDLLTEKKQFDKTSSFAKDDTDGEPQKELGPAISSE
ncbi:LAME_0E12134g1_1 [Lachancea meyersii CBS 8951]|uniref:LAME_0E12134g1_1 n=1 Tax=Lachancea meyersii CBS 8951 TaxID=1266667 RepID=A0A1G4JLG0_9SACH|nr:LAME_0E12134g1_1 [Lachancea meyersii CBS 8951]